MKYLLLTQEKEKLNTHSFSTLLSPTLLSACYKHIFHKPCRYEFYCVKVTVQGKVCSSYKYFLKSNSWRGKVCFNF